MTADREHEYGIALQAEHDRSVRLKQQQRFEAASRILAARTGKLFMPLPLEESGTYYEEALNEVDRSIVLADLLLERLEEVPDDS